MGKKLPDEPLEEIRKMTWGEYMKSRRWRHFSNSLQKDPNCTCEICGRKKYDGRYVKGKKKGHLKRKYIFNVHHKHYRNIGEEKREDVLVLCKACHSGCHDIETLSSRQGGIWTTLYNWILENTPWEYEYHRNKDTINPLWSNNTK